VILTVTLNAALDVPYVVDALVLHALGHDVTLTGFADVVVLSGSLPPARTGRRVRATRFRTRVSVEEIPCP
jgi:fructose-1-phosphate kinase PfkB-like protein